jgi:hypothetical protein
MHQVGDQPRLYYDAWSINHQDMLSYVGAATSNNLFIKKLATIMPNKNINNKDTSNCS